jgi:hypothetical protein
MRTLLTLLISNVSWVQWVVRQFVIEDGGGFVSEDSHKVMTTLVVMLPSNCCFGDFSAVS